MAWTDERTDDPAPAARPRQTLAMRLAARNDQRDLRAERLARLRLAAGAPSAVTVTAPPAAVAVTAAAGAAPDPESDEAALQEFLQALAGGLDARPAPAAAGAVLRFHGAGMAPSAPEPAPRSAPRSAAEAVGDDLDRLPGAGPGLVAALRRAGLRHLADVAGLEPEALAARLGPIGRLIPAGRWIAAARAAAPLAEAVPRRPDAAEA